MPPPAAQPAPPAPSTGRAAAPAAPGAAAVAVEAAQRRSGREGNAGGASQLPGTARRRVMLAVGALAVAAAPAKGRASASRRRQRWKAEEQSVTVPLVWREGAFCVRYKLSDVSRGSIAHAYWGVADTGSPFLLTGRCLRRDCPEYCVQWGCYHGEGEPSGLADTVEIYVSGQGNIQWRQGVTLSFPDATMPSQSAKAVAIPGLLFGVQGAVSGTGGTGSGVFLGLVRDRSPDIRPTFLEQTPFSTLGIDLREVGQEQLRLSSTPLRSSMSNGSVISLVDPRAWGDPVRHYAAIATSIRVGGNTLLRENSTADGDMFRYEAGADPLQARPRKVLCIFDTGTTGVSMTPGLYLSYWTAVRQSLEAGTSSSFREAQQLEVAFKPQGGGELVLDMYRGSHPTYGDSLDLVTQVEEIAWAGIGDPSSLARYGGVPVMGEVSAGGASALELPFDDVAFLGLGFLVGRNLDIDLGAGRMVVST